MVSSFLLLQKLVPQDGRGHGDDHTENQHKIIEPLGVQLFGKQRNQDSRHRAGDKGQQAYAAGLCVLFPLGRIYLK